LIDEAGMIGSDDMERLIAQIESSDDRAIFVGDPRQLAAVSAGSPFAQMIESESITVARISEIQRQKDPNLLKIAAAFAAGRAAEAVIAARPFMSEVAVHTSNLGADGKPLPTTMERRAAIAAAAARAYLDKTPDERASTLVLSGTNAVRMQVNDLIRAGLKLQREISGDEIEIIGLDKVDATKEALSRAVTYKTGMIVRLYENRRLVDYTVRDVAGGEGILVDDAGGEKRWKPMAGARVYTRRPMWVGQGDRIVFREPVGRGAERITNGSGGVVESVDLGKGIVSVRLDDGRMTTIDRKTGVAVDRGWALTVHLSQGRTVDSVIVAGESSRVATAESAYVACSRERHSLEIITDNITRLSKSWAGWAERKTALSATGAGEVDRERLAELRREAAEKLAGPVTPPAVAGGVDRDRARVTLR
jgi:ATP-dependent exoDNAse (exonuclease V) alpha subunit